MESRGEPLFQQFANDLVEIFQSAKLSCTCLYCNYIDYMLQHGGGQEPGRGVWKQFLDCLGVLSWKLLQDCTCVDGHAILELPNETGEHRMRSNGRDTWKKMRKEYTLASTCKYHMTGENSKGNFLSGSIQTNITKSSSGKQHCTAGKKRKEEQNQKRNYDLLKEVCMHREEVCVSRICNCTHREN